MVAQPSLSPAWVPAGALTADQTDQTEQPGPVDPPREIYGQIDSEALRMAVGDGSLLLLYQPEVDLRTGEIVAMEALLRWRHPALGIVSPHSFLALAQRTGLMQTIDTWVLAAAAVQAAGWRRFGGPIRTLWLNVSMAQLSAEPFVARLSHAIGSYDLPAGALGLEVSERILLRLEDKAAPLLAQLRALGVFLVADDFSSYYTALGNLASLPLDAVKLSHRFVRSSNHEAHDGRALNVINQAHARGMYVVAEGVETLAEHERLVGLGCDRAHGFLYSPPLPADQAGWLLKRRMAWRGVDAGQRELAASRPRP